MAYLYPFFWVEVNLILNEGENNLKNTLTNTALKYI